MDGQTPSSAGLRYLTEQRLFLADGLGQIASQIAFTPSDKRPNANTTVHAGSSTAGPAEGYGEDQKSEFDLLERDTLDLLTPTSDSSWGVRNLQAFRSLCLEALWSAAGQDIRDPKHPFIGASVDQPSKTKAVVKPPQSANNLGLLLLLPLLESQSRGDTTLRGATVKVLLDFLLEVSSRTINETIPTAVLSKLEYLLTTWLAEEQQPDVQCDTISALIALTSAKGSLSSLANTVGLLGSFDENLQLPFGATLDRLLLAKASYSIIFPSKPTRQCIWKYDKTTFLSEDLARRSSNPVFKHPKYPHKVQLCTRGSGWNCDGGCGYRSSRATHEMARYRSVDESQDFDLCAVCMGGVVQEATPTSCTDGIFLYVSGWTVQGVIKLGTGYSGTVRGRIYAGNTDLPLGRTTMCNGCLLHRPFSCDCGVLSFVLDPITLQKVKTLYMADHEKAKRPPTCSCGLAMQLSTYSSGGYRHGYICDRCGSQSSKGHLGGNRERWFCEACKADVCLSCHQKSQTEDVCFCADENSLYHVYFNDSGNDSTERVDIVCDTYDISEASASTTDGSDEQHPGFKATRSTLINTEEASAGSVPGRSTSSVGPKDRERTTSIGITLSSLRTACTFVSNGVLVVMSKPAHQQSFSSQTLTRIVFGGRENQTANNNKSLTFVQTCIALHAGLSVHPFSAGRVQLSEAITLDLSRLSELSICVEAGSNSIWVVTGGIVEHILGKRMKTERRSITAPVVSQQSKTASIGDAVDSMFRLLQAAANEREYVDPEEQLNLTAMSISMVQLACERRKLTALTSAIKVLRLCVLSDLRSATPKYPLLAEEFVKLRECLFRHLSASCDGDFVTTLSKAACADVVVVGMPIICPTDELKKQLVMNSCSVTGTFFDVTTLRNGVLKCLPSMILSAGADFGVSKNKEGFFQIVDALFAAAVAEAKSSFDAMDFVSEGPPFHPTASPTVVALSAIQSALFSRCMDDFKTGLQRPESIDHVLKFTVAVIQASELLLDASGAAIKQHGKELHARAKDQLDELLKSTLLGFLLPCTTSAHRMPQLRSALTLQENADIASRLEALLTGACTVVNALQDADIGFDDFSVPKPWERGIVVESIHPLRDNYKFSKTMSFPGAEALYLTFDSRCCSQYDYDKLTLSTGKPPRIIEQYAGNTAGYGSPSVLGSGWPKSTIRIPGDTVHIDFEMRSGRESSTPDSAMWGFKITIRDEEFTDDVGSTFSFMTDLHLSLASWISDLISVFYTESNVDPAELAMESVFRFDMFQNDTVVTDIKHSTIAECPEQLLDMVKSAKSREPMYPATVREAVNPIELQNLFVQAAVSSIGPIDSIAGVPKDSALYSQFSTVVDHIVDKLRGVERLLLELSNFERMWWSAVDAIRDHGTSSEEPFFKNWYVEGGKSKELSQLCQLVGFDLCEGQEDKAMTDLTAALHADAIQSPAESRFPRTKRIAEAIKDRCRLLLSIQLKPDRDWVSLIMGESEYLSDDDDDADLYRTFSSSTTTVGIDPPRAFSAPPVLEVLKMEIGDGDQSRSLGPVPQEVDERSPAITLLENEFVQYLMIDVFKESSQYPLAALVAVVARRQGRGASRIRALKMIRALLKPSITSKILPPYLQQFFIERFTELMSTHPIDSDLGGSGLASSVRREVASAMREMTTLIGANPVTYYRGLGLCRIPFTRRQAVCITDSAMINLLDDLCASTWPAVSTTSWAAFHYLAFRCARWAAQGAEPVSSRHVRVLSKQLSSMLSNHLQAIAKDLRGSFNWGDVDPSERRMQVLTIVDNLAGSQLGRAVVSNPESVVALLQFLSDDTSSPKLLNVVARLLAVALPGLQDSLQMLELLNNCINLQVSSNLCSSDSAKARIVSIMIAKISQLVVPPCKGCFEPNAVVCKDIDRDVGDVLSSEGTAEPVRRPMPSIRQSSPGGHFVIKLYRRPDQSARDVIETLLRLNRRLFHKDSVENVVRVDQELNDNSVAVAFRGSYSTCRTVAMEWAQLGVVVQIERESSGGSTSIESSSAEVQYCKKLNVSLSQRPARHFVDGAVAGGIVRELVGLIQSLMTGVTATWDADIEIVLRNALEGIPELADALACDNGSPPSSTILERSRQALAALCVMGATRDDIHAGGYGLIGGSGLAPTVGQVQSYEAQQGYARIAFPSVDVPVKVPVNNLLSAHNTPPKRVVQLLNDAAMAAADSLLVTGAGHSMGVQSSSSSSTALIDFSHRLLADLRTRACLLMCTKLRAGVKLPPSAKTCEIIRRAAMEAQDFTENSISLAEAACTAIRRPYFNQFRPPIPVLIKSENSSYPEWDISSAYPPLSGVMVMNENSTLRSVRVVRRDGSNKRTHPIVFASSPLPLNSGYAYWEARVTALPASTRYRSHQIHEHALERYDNDNGWGCDGASQPDNSCPNAMGETTGVERYRCTQGWDFDLCGECMKESVPCEAFQIGFAPRSKKSGWKWPVESVMFSSESKIRKRTTSDPGLVETTLYNLAERQYGRIGPGDTVGCLLDKGERTVTFFVNGNPATKPIPASDTTLTPVIHLKSPDVEIETKLKIDPTDYPGDFVEHTIVDSSAGVGSQTFDAQLLNVSQDHPSAPIKVVGSYALPLSGSSLSGSHHVVVGEEEEEEEDLTEQLIQAWQREVFPKINSRFRNSLERQSGFDQIRGALQFNMPEVAMDTVAGLYDDSGGIPSDLHLPTMEDLKAAAGRLGANEIQSGMRVRNTNSGGPAPFEVGGMKKTRQLIGTVVKVDKDRSLALVEMYVGADASLVHWWYPCNVLELADDTFETQTSDLGTCHSEFLLCESKLTRLYCRSALLILKKHSMVELPVMQALQLMSYESRASSRPGNCFLRNATARTFYDCDSTSFDVLNSNLKTALEVAASTGSTDKLISDMCALLSSGSDKVTEYATIPIIEGQKIADIQFSAQLSDVLVSLYVGENSTKKLPTLTGDDGPWLRIYARQDCNGPRSAVYPCAESGSPYPYYSISSTRLHIRIRPSDVPSTLKLCLHGLHRDVPLALMFIQGPLLGDVRVPDEDLLRVADVLIANLTHREGAPAIREIYQHSLAAIIRKLGPVFSPEQRSAISSLSSICNGESVSEQSEENRFSTYFQSLMELALAEQVNNRIFNLRKYRDNRASRLPRSPTASKDIHDPGISRKSVKRKRGDGRGKDSSDEVKRKTSSSSKSDGVRVKSWVRRAADTELCLRHLAGWIEEESVASAMEDDLVEMGYAHSLDTHVWKCIIGVYRLSSTLDNEELRCTINKLTKSCGGVVGDIYISSEYKDLGRCAIFLVKSSTVTSRVRSILQQCTQLRGSADLLFFDVNLCRELPVVAPLPDSQPEDRSIQIGAAVDGFLRALAVTENGDFCSVGQAAFKSIFGLTTIDSMEAEVSLDQLLSKLESGEEHENAVHDSYNLASVVAFLKALGCDTEEDCAELISICDNEFVSPTKLLKYTELLLTRQPGKVWTLFISYGFDLHFNRYRYQSLKHAIQHVNSHHWLPEVDELLVSEIDELALSLHVQSLSLSAADYAANGYSPLLKDFSLVAIRLRMCSLIALNSKISELLPAIDFRGEHMPLSLASLVTKIRHLVLYDVKSSWIDCMIEKTAQREDSNGPEITLNPLQVIRGKRGRLADSHFMQALTQLEDVDPELLRVRLARGGDPIFPINVRLTGEHVAGSSGSFREFLARMVTELRTGVVPLLCESPSAAFGKNQGCYILKTGPVDYFASKMYEMLGMIFAMAIRADVPLALEMLPAFWKRLVGESLDINDLREVDFRIVKQHGDMRACTTEEEFNSLVVKESITLTYQSLGRNTVDLAPTLLGESVDGSAVPVSWALRDRYVDLVEAKMLEELQCKSQTESIRRGMAKIMSLELLSIMTWKGLETRVCGRSTVDLAFLKAHTTYTVGLSESDSHIVYFWNALESFTQDQLCAFVKFACNQHRIPSGANVPPYPMKIAPPDKGRTSDRRWIRAETCMFMIKLPQYSTQEIMTERLLDAIQSRDDPLIG